MAAQLSTRHVGDATVTIFDLYDIPSKMAELVDAPKAERAPADEAVLSGTVDLPVQCILVQLGGQVVLVDAGEYEAEFDASGRALAAPRLLDLLARVGARPDGVQHVVITHAHGDHFNAMTIEREGGYTPAFPRAQVCVGRGDWEADRLRQGLGNPSSLESRTFGVLERAGRLTPVDGSLELGSGIAIVALPGETPGHQGLRVHSAGETLYCVGDLWHHPIEVDHPTWMVPWADREANLHSRRAVAEAALAENALIVATHIVGFGRLKRTGTGVEWESLPRG
jgi:glyoxylase-like metal-dependent hydrolase (beta-lactamase superfamily II)